MTGDIVFIEEGALETRAAVIRDGVVRRLWFGPALGAEASDQAPRFGRTFVGKVSTIDSRLNAAFVDIGADRDAFLPLKSDGARDLTEGARVSARVTASPRQSKGALIEYLKSAPADHPLGRASPIASAPSESLSFFAADRGAVKTSSPAVVDALRQGGVEAPDAMSDAALEAIDFDHALEAALSRRAPLPAGGSIVIDEAEALTAIDVDTGAAFGASDDRQRVNVIRAAACEAARQIELRNLGGRLAIDFPAVRSSTLREKSADAIRQALAPLRGVSSLSLTRGNFLTMTVDRRDGSLLDQATETGEDDPVPGRRLTLDWRARAAVREAERRLAVLPGARLYLHAGRELHDHLVAALDAREAFFRRHGARLDILLDTTATGRHWRIDEG
ncbi:MAG: ribonuclease E/G [Pseudomonadota bacterium]